DPAAFDAHWKRILDSTGTVNKTILRGGEVAGHIACYPREGKLEVTYWHGKEHWGKGVATQALKQLLQEISHRPLFARAAKDNIGSIRVLQKCDFKIIGETRILPREEMKKQRNIFFVWMANPIIKILNQAPEPSSSARPDARWTPVLLQKLHD